VTDSTGRRAWGVALVVLSVLAVTAVAASRRTFAGTATAAPVPPPPAIGDCLLGQPTGLGWDDSLGQGPGSSPDDPPAGAEIGPCAGLRFGEIVQLDPAAGTVEGQLSRWSECDRQAALYLGWPRPSDDPDAVWQPTIMIRTGFVWPSRRQQAAGQTWAACVVTLPPDDFAQSAILPVDYPLRGGWTVADVRNRVGTCGRDFQTPAPCGQPHRLETLAFANLESSTLTQEQLDQGCRDQVAAQTRMPDITAGGSLSTHVTIFVMRGGIDSDLTVPDLDSVRSLDSVIYSYAQCVVSPTAADRRLTGSLRELGDAPVPFTG
jgi:hypothetical protein